MLFSILIANYNNGSFFKDCFDSIIGQTYQNYEVIIVDDKSTDNSLSIIRELIGNDSRFKLFESDRNNGCATAKKRCIDLASGTLCGFLDPDDAITPNAIEAMVEAHENNPNASFASSKYYLTDLNLKNLRETFHAREIPAGFSFLTFGRGAVTAFMSFKKVNFSQSIGLNLKYKRAIDQDLNFLLEEVGEHVFLDKFLYLYRINQNSISGNNNVFKARYWHYVVMKDAYERRLKSNSNVINFTKMEFKKMCDNYIVSRMVYETSQKNYCNKYYFLMKSILSGYQFNLKYKLVCFVRPNYA